MFLMTRRPTSTTRPYPLVTSTTFVRACRALSRAAHSPAERAIGVVCMHRIRIMAQERATKPLKAVTTGKWTRVKAACSDPVGAVLHVLYDRLSAVTSDARFGSIDCVLWRSEGRRVGQEWVSTCRSRWAPDN